MAKFRTIKTSFNGGEISKQLYGRVDLESFINSNKQLKNVLPTVYGSAMNRGGTVFVNDNIKYFYQTLQEITGVTDTNCMSIDWNFSHFVFGCDNGYIVRCDFDFSNIIIVQILYNGNPIGDLKSVAQVGWYIDRNDYKFSTDTNSYVFVPNNANWSSYTLLIMSDDNQAEKLFDLAPYTNPKRNSNTLVSFDGLKLRFLTSQLSGLLKVSYSYDVSDNSTNDFDGFYVDDNNFVLRNDDNVFWYHSESVISLGIVSGDVVGAKLQGNNVCVYTYKTIGEKYCIIGNIYNVSGELLEQKTIVSFDSDYGINRAILFNDKELFIGSVASVCVVRSTVFPLDFTGTCLSYAINNDGQIMCCDGGDDISIIDSYDYSDTSTKRVLIPFKVNKLINYVVEFGNKIIRFYKNRELVKDGDGDVYEIGSPYGITDLIDDEGKLKISYVQNVDVLYICNKDFPIQVLKRYGDANWVIEDFSMVGGPFGNANSDKNKTLVSTQTEGLITVDAVNNSSNLTLVSSRTYYGTRTAQYVGVHNGMCFWQLDGATVANSDGYYCSVAQAAALLANSAIGQDLIISYNDETINITVKQSAGTAYNGKNLRLFRMRILHSEGYTHLVEEYDRTETFSASSTPVDVFTEDMVDKLIRLNYIDSNTVMWETGKSITTGAIRKSGNNYYKATSNGTTGQIKPIHTSGVVSDGGVSWEYLHSGYGVGTILEVVSASQIKVNADGYFPDFTYGTYLWELGIVGGGVYPNCCALYKERFVFSISTADGTKICASCAGDYNNFSDNSFGDILPENAITVLLQGNQESLVLWMHALNKLYIGTACEEFIFGEQTIAEVLSPTNVMCVKVSSLGSAAIEPLQILDELFFISNNEKQIANFTYIAERDSFRPMNISVMFEHLLHNGVKCWAYTKEPYKIIWFADRDGNLRSISYDTDNKVCAGARHDIGGKVVSLAVIPEPNGNYDELWMVVERVVADQTVYYTERLSWGLPQEDVTDDYKNKHGVYCDCAKVFESDVDVSEITGLYFLEGKTVKVVVDGKIQNDKTVVDGTIELDSAGKVIVVGIGYDWLIETLFLNIGANDGTAQGLPQRISKLIGRFINTRYCEAKASEGNRFEVIVNKDDMVDDDFEIHPPSDYSRKMTMFLRGDKPVSCCILCLVAEMQTYR